MINKEKAISKFKKLSPKMYKVKQSNMLYELNNPLVF